MTAGVCLVAEGYADMMALERLCSAASIDVLDRVQCRGKHDLDGRIGRYRQAAAATGTRWLVLRDLDRDAACPGEFRARPDMARATAFELRLAVRALESWVLADFETFRRACGFGRKNPPLPANRDELEDPKQKLLDLVRAHGSKNARRRIVGPAGQPRQSSPGYTTFLREHLASRWRPDVARASSTSLDRAMRFLERSMP